MKSQNKISLIQAVLKSDITIYLITNSCFCLLLLLYRFFSTNSLFFGFLIWNLFLALIPLFITSFLLPRADKKKPWNSILYFLSWLFFLPNAPYIITDFIHFKHQTAMPYWFDILLLTSFTINGLIMGIISMIQMRHYLESHFTKRKVQLIMFTVCFLCGFGIYLGRFLRFNSWDIITNPLNLLQDIAAILIHPADHLKAWGVTLGFGMLLWIVYSLFNSLKSIPYHLHNPADKNTFR